MQGIGVEIECVAPAETIDALASLDIYAQAESIPTDNLTDFLAGTIALDRDFEQQMRQAGWLKQIETVLTGLTIPALGAGGKAFVRSAMELRIAKLAIALRLFEKQNGNFPESIDELTPENMGVDPGPVMPVGEKPFGYRLDQDDAELWGFDPQDAADQTPDQPTPPSQLPEGNEHLEFWYWKLPRG